MENKQNINEVTPWDSIQEYLKTGEKSEELLQWENSKTENRQLFLEIRKAWLLTGKIPKSFTPNKEKAWEIVDKKTSNKKSFFFNFKKAIAAAAALLLVFTTWWISNTPQKTSYTTFICPKGQKSQILLPDSTKVWLNGGTKIIYPTQFSNSNRSVELLGEAFFHVKRNEKSPFTVKSNDIKVIVLGTEFNVRNYDDDQAIQVGLQSGKVKIKGKECRSTQLYPGQLATWHKTYKKIDIEKAKLDAITAWTRNELVFSDNTFREVATYLERWYGVEINLDSRFVKDDHLFNFKVKTESLTELLRLMQVMVPMQFTIDGKRVTIKKP
ncbi:FecR family protein [Prolixibacteraceae bacterium JC049]|nr:FecR family protein [Prolixibacteraceae bacterium JC049]